MLAMRAELAKDGYSVRFNMNRISQTMLDDAFSALILEVALKCIVIFKASVVLRFFDFH